MRANERMQVDIPFLLPTGTTTLQREEGNGLMESAGGKEY